jgi:hypothetical protein
MARDDVAIAGLGKVRTPRSEEHFGIKLTRRVINICSKLKLTGVSHAAYAKITVWVSIRSLLWSGNLALSCMITTNVVLGDGTAPVHRP